MLTIFQRFNQPKTLSGIETEKAATYVKQNRRASTNPKPFQGLKPLLGSLSALIFIASTNSKPFQGLKRVNTACIAERVNALQPTQNPFRD